MAKSHELMILLGGTHSSMQVAQDRISEHAAADDFKVISTTLRFDPFDWMSFKAIRALWSLKAFGQVGRGSLYLVPVIEIVTFGLGHNQNELLLKHEDAKIIPVYVRDSTRGAGLQPNNCFLHEEPNYGKLVKTNIRHIKDGGKGKSKEEPAYQSCFGQRYDV
jgi:hypothetical protein